jgi:hypothetical protein
MDGQGRQRGLRTRAREKPVGGSAAERYCVEVTGMQAPKIGEFLIRLFLAREDQEAILGDLNEAYIRDEKRLGTTMAGILYYRQVAISIWPLVRKMLIRLSALASIEELVRRKIGS